MHLLTSHQAHLRRRQNQGIGRSVTRTIHRIHFQDSSKHEPSAPRPYCVCAYLFRRIHPGMDITVNRSQKKMKLSHTTQFMADSRETVKAAVAGDIIGLYDTGNFQIGDTIYSGKRQFSLNHSHNSRQSSLIKFLPKNVMKQNHSIKESSS